MWVLHGGGVSGDIMIMSVRAHWINMRVSVDLLLMAVYMYRIDMPVCAVEIMMEVSVGE